MNCHACGAPLNGATGFCPNCGAAVPANNAQQPNFQQPYQQPYQQPGFQQPYQQPDSPTPGKGLGIPSLILGIVSLVLFCFWYLSIPCAIASIILGAIGKSKAKAAGKSLGIATGGIVCSIVALALDVIIMIVGTAFLAELGLL